MISTVLTLAFLGCVSSGAMLSMLLLLVVAYVSAAVWLISHGAVYSGLLYVLVYVGAIVVLIMFVVQLTNTSLTLTSHHKNSSSVGNVVLVLSVAVLLSIAISSDVLLNLAHEPETMVSIGLPLTSNTPSLGVLASTIFNEYGYVLVLSVHAIILAVIGPIKLALADYTRSTNT